VEYGEVALTERAVVIDRSLPLAAEPATGHNRWHPDIRPIVGCDPGDEVVFQTRDAIDGQVKADSADELWQTFDRLVVHPLTGPVFVQGAVPGDLLEVEILEVATVERGYTYFNETFGLLRAYVRQSFLAHWAIADGWATSPQIPGVRIPGDPFIGTIGVAPDRDLLLRATARERRVREAGGLASLPDARDAVPSDPAIAGEALRTIPPRENGGNLDIKQLGAGSRLYLPVLVPGALLSVGDCHFAQGDGEVCGTAIETWATVRLRCRVLPGEAAAKGIRWPQFAGASLAVGAERLMGAGYLATTGMAVDDDGEAHFEDVTLAARQALRSMIRLLMERGYSWEQAYSICSVAVDLRISELVDVPMPVVSAILPLSIFEGG
jgi:formamidase